MRCNREPSVRTLVVVLLIGFVLTVGSWAAFAQKTAKSYPEKGKVTGRGTTGHTMGGNSFDTQTYKVETEKTVFVLDCGKKPFFGKTGGECGGEKKIQIGDEIHFRIEKNSVYIPVTEAGVGGVQEQKLRILSQDMKPDSKSEKTQSPQAKWSDSRSLPDKSCV